VVEWSWDLLDAREREVAEHVAVFAAGAGEDAVAAVCPSWRAGADRSALTDVLHALVDKSLLVPLPTPDGTRFRMLETLREYGAGRLAADGRAAAAREAHARWYAGLVAAADRQLRGPGQLAALRLLDTEHDDVLQAMRHLVDTGDAVAAVTFAVDLGWYWTLRESQEEADRWLSAALALPGADDCPLAPFARALQVVLSSNGGPLGAAHSDPDVVRALDGELDRVEHLRPALGVLRPLLLLMAGAPEEAAVLADRSLHGSDPWVRAAVRLVRLAFGTTGADLGSLRAEAAAGLAEWERVGDRWGIAALLSARGHIRTLDGDLPAQRRTTSGPGSWSATSAAAPTTSSCSCGWPTCGCGRATSPVPAGTRPRCAPTAPPVRARCCARCSSPPPPARWPSPRTTPPPSARPGPSWPPCWPGCRARALRRSGRHRPRARGSRPPRGPPRRPRGRGGTPAHRAPGRGRDPGALGAGHGRAGRGRVGARARGAAGGRRPDRCDGAAARREDTTDPVLVRLTAGLREALGGAFDDATAEGLALDPAAAADRLDPAAVAACAHARRR
jgi:hypothetical protein